MASDLALLALVKQMQGFTGPQGPQGPEGPQGVQGQQGPAGKDGRDGKDGAAGPQGPAGPQGLQGPQGPQGPAGEAGANGQDGIGVESAYVAADGSLVFTLTDGSEVDVGPLSGLSVASEGNTYVIGQGNKANSIYLEGMAGPAIWNNIEGTVDFPLNEDVTLQLGQEELVYAKASEAISNGDVVMFDSAQGDHLLVKKADVTAPGFRQELVIGVATQGFDINEFGYVTSFGKVRELNTLAFNEGDLLWLSATTPGALTNVEPTKPACSVLVAAVTRSHGTQGTIFVRPATTSRIDELCNVSSATPNDGDVLAWDAAQGIWKPIAPVFPALYGITTYP
jgi:hypothetical protein